jgi:hypothetical protein
MKLVKIARFAGIILLLGLSGCYRSDEEIRKMTREEIKKAE